MFLQVFVVYYCLLYIDVERLIFHAVGKWRVFLFIIFRFDLYSFSSCSISEKFEALGLVLSKSI